jgi:hypothetical protein
MSENFKYCEPEAKIEPESHFHWPLLKEDHGVSECVVIDTSSKKV